MGIFGAIELSCVICNWASLNPIAKVFDVAALPAELEEDDDWGRVWNRMRYYCFLTLVNVLPDAVAQMWLQARYLGLAFDDLTTAARLQMVFSILLSGLSAAVAVK